MFNPDYLEDLCADWELEVEETNVIHTIRLIHDERLKSSPYRESTILRTVIEWKS